MTKYCYLCMNKTDKIYESEQYDNLCYDCYLGEIGEYDV